MIEALLNDPSHANYDMSSLRTIAYGASPMYVDRIKSAVQTFGPIFVQTYALGEAPRGCTCLKKSEHVWSDADSERRSEEHTSELQSLMRISYAVFCLKKKIQTLTSN